MGFIDRTVEGVCDSKRSIGQIHFCDVCGEMETPTQKQQALIGLFPALELLFASANCQEEQKCEPSSLTNILSVLLTAYCSFVETFQ